MERGTGVADSTPQNKTILAIDPGTEKSGWCIFQDGKVSDSGIDENDVILSLVYGWLGGPMAIEMVSSYGMPVGREVFETVLWIGRFVEAHQSPESVRLVYRKDVKLHLCGSPKAKDGNIRQALIDMFPRTGGGKTPQVGTKKQPGPLFGVSSHAWSALAVAVYATHQRELEAA
ncbi:hypothetical protein BGLT_02227 [Caballeronia glathei]|nr:hypothetical protein [Caballeronia glathei]CDY79446.1 hypothetical protein BGLT_02227 [Caballeronia glathei]